MFLLTDNWLCVLLGLESWCSSVCFSVKYNDLSVGRFGGTIFEVLELTDAIKNDEQVDNQQRDTETCQSSEVISAHTDCKGKKHTENQRTGQKFALEQHPEDLQTGPD